MPKALARPRLLRLSLISPLIAAIAFAAAMALADEPAAEESHIADLELQRHVSAQIASAGASTVNLSRVNVTNPAFASGCANAADPAGRADSTCAIRSAARYASLHGVNGGGFPLLYFPHGRYRVAGEGFISAITLSVGIGVVGDGPENTVIYNSSPAAATLTYKSATGNCSNKPGACFIRIEGLTFAATGHRSLGGLVEIDNTDTGLMRDVVLADTGGIALNLQGSSERWIFSQMEISDARWPVLTEGDTNENYFDRINVINSAQDEEHYCFSVNCPGGQIAQSGAWLPDPHSAVYMDGDNVHWMNSSIKSTAQIGGIRMAPVTSSVSHSYFEGFPWGDQPRSDHAIEAPGKLELGHTTAAIGTGDLTIPVDDAGWQPLYVNDPAYAFVNGEHAHTNAYMIFPSDYVFDSKEPSHAVSGITRGTFEFVKVASFAGDGKAHLYARAQNHTGAVAWPAGSIIEQIPPNSYGTQRIEENHINSVTANPGRRYSSGCSDTAQRQDHWTSSPSQLCADIIAGLVPDGFAVPLPTQHYLTTTFVVHIVDNSIFYGGTEQEGEGWIKVPGSAELTINQGNGLQQHFVDAATAMTTYVNDTSHVQLVRWGNTTAFGRVHDLSGRVDFSPQNGYYSADVYADHSLSHQYIGDPCWYNAVKGSTQPTSRFCIRPTGSTEETFTNGRWVATSSYVKARKFAMRDWNPGTLAPRGQAGDCVTKQAPATGATMSTEPSATLVVNLSPNPGVQVTGWVAQRNVVSVQVCNPTGSPVSFRAAPVVLFTQLE